MKKLGLDIRVLLEILMVYFHISLGWIFLDYSVNDRTDTSETEKVHTFGEK